MSKNPTVAPTGVGTYMTKVTTARTRGITKAQYDEWTNNLLLEALSSTFEVHM